MTMRITTTMTRGRQRRPRKGISARDDRVGRDGAWDNAKTSWGMMRRINTTTRAQDEDQDKRRMKTRPARGGDEAKDEDKADVDDDHDLHRRPPNVPTERDDPARRTTE